MRSLNSRTFGVLLSLEPAIAALMGWIFLRQPITFLQDIAIAVVIAASIVSTLGRTRHRRSRLTAIPMGCRARDTLGLVVTIWREFRSEAG